MEDMSQDAYNSSESDGSESLLHAASEAGDATLIAELVRQGEDVGGLDDEDWTPLMWATDVATVVALLAAHSNPRYVTPHGESVLMVLARRANPEALTHLILAAGLDVNAAAETGNTALMEAAAVGALENVRVLLNHGACPTTRTEKGGRAEDAALRWGYEDVAEVLRQAYASAEE